MAGFGELNSVQAPLVQALSSAGWKPVLGAQLGRSDEDPFIESAVVDALARLNPVVAANRSLADEILMRLRAVTLTVADVGLVAANRDFSRWLRGLETHQFVGQEFSVPVRLVDTENVDNNEYVVSYEVPADFGLSEKKARFDVVLFVNGFPLVVGELKTPADFSTSWFNGATDLLDVYEPKFSPFFVPNVVTFASEGKEFMYAGIGTPAQHWTTWGAVSQHPSLQGVLDKATSMLTPRAVIDLLADYTLFEEPTTNAGTGLVKIVPRYTQYEAVSRIVARAKDPDRNRALVYHTQGSGKTLAMVFAAGKLLTDPVMKNPTVVLVADRVDLVAQTWNQFRTTGLPALRVPQTAAELQKLLADDQRGLVFTTVHKFAGAGVLTGRSNVVVMVDEAHRTQEGDLGVTMRAALPNATLVGFTGTPIAELDRNTFATFGDESDDKRTLHSYTSDQSIADGTTVPIHVSPRKVEFALDKAALDEAFTKLKADADLTDEEADALVRKLNKTSAFFSNPDRIRAVCEDIVEHFYSTIDPLGMKAQVVVLDRALCVAYQDELTRFLTERAHGRGECPDESAVVMSVGNGKNEDPQFAPYALSQAAEQALLKRFRTFGDPLKFLVCTSKLGTGFDAPIEGVMYLDKPLRKHTLFQTITRTNRLWRNPTTGKDKRFGTVVDYVGLGSKFAEAMLPPNSEQGARDIEVDGLLEAFTKQLDHAMLRFSGIDVEKITATTLIEAQKRLPDTKARETFAAEYLFLEGIWESLAPSPHLVEHKAAYVFLAKLYASIQPSTSSNALLWQRLGAKTLDIVWSNTTDITVSAKSAAVIADADTIKTLIAEGLIDDPVKVEHQSAEDVIDSISARLKKKLAGPTGHHPVYQSLSERLEALRAQSLAEADASIEWLRKLFTLAKDLTVAERAEEESGRSGLDVLPDPNIGALTQIFTELAPKDTPVSIEVVVHDVDQIVKQVRYDGWASTQKGDMVVRQQLRLALKKHQLHAVPGLFDRAYEYIHEHY